ncbi:hypothetical protein IRJ41_005772 [Triplophysa rosa]|uniref:Uncharacterized protein n=1 Tax=Triplophysa rosa TaxID=992332 RepID=A0A9W7T8C5_TRIRA|nr:hypothetical protein IRJ41_005772 [Triplophysa rosa]
MRTQLLISVKYACAHTRKFPLKGEVRMRNLLFSAGEEEVYARAAHCTSEPRWGTLGFDSLEGAVVLRNQMKMFVAGGQEDHCKDLIGLNKVTVLPLAKDDMNRILSNKSKELLVKKANEDDWLLKKVIGFTLLQTMLL